MTRWLMLGLVGVAVVASWVVFNPVGVLQGLEDDDDQSTTLGPRSQSEIAVGDLIRTVEGDGRLLLSASRLVSTSRAGVVTDIADVGQPIEPSATLFELDGVPTVALLGDVPAWRELTTDTVGPDVAQLEANLVALGYDARGLLTVDETYTDYTADLVEEWQSDLGLEATGTVAVGLVVFVPEGSVVTSVLSSVGSQLAAGGENLMLGTAVTDRVLEVVVPADEVESIAPGTVVTATLPDRATVSATVTGLSPAGDGTSTATAVLDEAEEIASLPDGEAVPVTVAWDEQLATGAKTVQADALTRLDSGSYVVEVVVAGGTEFVEVELGNQVGSTVEVVTGLGPGTVVVTP